MRRSERDELKCKRMIMNTGGLRDGVLDSRERSCVRNSTKVRMEYGILKEGCLLKNGYEIGRCDDETATYEEDFTTFIIEMVSPSRSLYHIGM